MEANPKDSVFPSIHYPTPGLTLKATAAPAIGNGWRGLYFATNKALYGVCGSSVYAIAADMTLTLLGLIQTSTGPVAMIDNGNFVVIVDGSSAGYTIALADNTFALITQAAFAGGDSVQVVDGFLVLNYPGTFEWYISLDSQITFDPTDFASKNGFPDRIVGLAVVNRYIYLFGESTSEVWFNAGNALFTFERLPGVFMQYGCSAAATIAQMDGELYWLAQSPQGNCLICRTSQFQAAAISTFALDAELATYERIDDAFAFTYQIGGHFFYVITFPTADKTWVYDLSTKEWNEWLWLDGEGAFHRHRANCFAFAYGMPLVGDWENGNLYLIDSENYTDNDAPISRLRSFFHAMDGNASRISYREFIADMEVGNGAGYTAVPLFLRWSDTRGKSWGNAISTSLGLEGEYLKSLQFQRLGMARDRVFELSWSAPVKTALSGAFVDATPNNQ